MFKGTADVIRFNGTAGVIRFKETTDVIRFTGTADVIRFKGTADVIRFKGTAGVIRFKGTAGVILSNIPLKRLCLQFITLPFKPLFSQTCGKYCRFLALNQSLILTISDNVSVGEKSATHFKKESTVNKK